MSINDKTKLVIKKLIHQRFWIKALWEKSGHWEKFGDSMYTSETPDEKIFAIKPMNCPGCIQVFNQGLKKL